MSTLCSCHFDTSGKTSRCGRLWGISGERQSGVGRLWFVREHRGGVSLESKPQLCLKYCESPVREGVPTVPDVFALIDDKHVPLFRVVWGSDVPHFCGNEDCLVEGRYEIRLEADESVFGTREERDAVLTALEDSHGGSGAEGDTS